MKALLVLPLLAVLALAIWGPWGASDAGGKAAARPRIVSAEPGFPLTIGLPSGHELHLAEPPQRILAANAATVDFLAVLVSPKRVVALAGASDVYSSLAALPAEAATGWGEPERFDGYLAEIVLGHNPDLVLAHSWQSPETTAILLDAGVAVLSAPLPRSWEEVLDTLAFLGRVLDAEERARAVHDELEERRLSLAERFPAARGLSAICYSNLGAGGTTAGAGTTADVLFRLAGLRNAASEAGIVGHESIDHERLLALDPDVIVVGTLEDSGERPPSQVYLLGQADLTSLRALGEDGIVALPPRLFTTTSLALLDAAEGLAAEIQRRRE